MSSAFAAIPKTGPFSEENVELLNRNKFYAEDLDHAGILAAFDPIFAAYAARCEKGERFGDFCIRAAPTRGAQACTATSRTNASANVVANRDHDRDLRAADFRRRRRQGPRARDQRQRRAVERS